MRAPEFWARNDLSARAISAALSPAGWAYGASVAWKRDHASPFRPHAKVICVGNITSGGSGKTPVAIAIARALLARGVRVAFLSRGYGGALPGPVLVQSGVHGAHDVGDEPMLLAEIAPTIVSRDRMAGAALADAQGAEVIVMDDGHQNFGVAKGLSLVVIDAESGFGNGCVLPAGPLREPVRQGLARADAVILVGNGSPDLAGYRGPTFRARLSAADSILANTRIVAFAGIGRPEKFFDTLRAQGADLVARHAFADHHPYTHEELAALRAKAASAGAALVTTEKDFVRLNASDRSGILTLKVRATFDAPDALERLLEKAIGLSS